MSAAEKGSALHRHRWPIAVGTLVLVALGLRLWGIDHGLPYAYNADENAHFVPKAIGFFGHSYNPQYFVNPPGYTYLLHAVFAVWFGGREGVSEAYATDPTEVFVVARVTAAVLGAVAVGLLYVAGKRIFDRRVGFMAAALLAVGFLPVFYSHLALNDVPALAPTVLALVGAGGILRRGKLVDYALAGGALGVACAVKYTAGILLLCVLAAAGARLWAQTPRQWRPVALGLGLALVAAVAGFALANPYALLDYDTFREGLERQSEASGDSTGKLGLTHDSGVLYYLWTLTWGLGWVPAIAAAAGGLCLLVTDRWRAAMLLAPPVLFVFFMGSQERYFGRWLLPIFPLVCVLAAFAAVTIAEELRPRGQRARRAALAVGAAALLAQAVVYTVHSDLVLSREDTRNDVRAWLVDHVPAGTKLVVEPINPDQWAHDPGRPSRVTRNGNRWIKWPTARSTINNDGTVRRGRVGRRVNLEDYERTTRPELLRAYQDGGFCWVITGSTQYGRAFAEPQQVPRAIAYYRALRHQGKVAYRASPYDDGAGPVEFNFDWSFDYYPLAYRRPGPDVVVYRLGGGRCAR